MAGPPHPQRDEWFAAFHAEMEADREATPAGSRSAPKDAASSDFLTPEQRTFVRTSGPLRILGHPDEFPQAPTVPQAPSMRPIQAKGTFGPPMPSWLEIANEPFEALGEVVGAFGLDPIERALPRRRNPRRKELSRESRGILFSLFSGGDPNEVIIKLAEQQRRRPFLEQLGLQIVDPFLLVPPLKAAKLGIFGARVAPHLARGIGKGAAARYVATPKTPLSSVKKFVDVIAEHGPQQLRQAELRTAERAKRLESVAASQEAARGLAGGELTTEAFRESLRGLAGDLPKVEFSPAAPRFTREEMTELTGLVDAASKPGFDFINNRKAFESLMFGADIPQARQIERLEDIFGTDLVEAIVSRKGAGTWNEIVEAANVPRAILGSWDISAPLRQGWAVVPGYPKQASEGFVAMFKSLKLGEGGEQAAKLIDEAIKSDELFGLAERSGLYYAPRRGRGIRASAREEAFMTKWAQHIPGVRVSERAYVTFLNKMRHDMFYWQVRQWEKDAAEAAAETGSAMVSRPLQDFEDLAKALNWSTGRGPLPGGLANAGALLNALFFSTRLNMSRIAIPVALLRGVLPGAVGGARPAGLDILARGSLSSLSSASMILGAASMSGVADVELDPRSSDFAKLKIGPTRLDFFGGFQQWMRYTAQFVARRRKTGTGRIEEVMPLDVAWRLFRTKLAPVPALGVDLLAGENIIGEQINFTPGGLTRAAFDRLFPMFGQDLIDAIDEQGMLGGMMALPAALGVGAVSYTSMRDAQNAESNARYGEDFDDLMTEPNGLELQEAVTRSANVQKVIDRFESRRQEGPSSIRLRDARRTYNNAAVREEAKVRAHLDAGMVPGKALREVIQNLTRAKQSVWEGVVPPDLQEWADAHIEDKVDIFRNLYWDVQPKADLATGMLDFSAVEAERQRIVEQAALAGVPEQQVTFRRSLEDPVVDAIVKEYRADMETLRPYFRVPEQVIRDPRLLTQYRTQPSHQWSRRVSGFAKEIAARRLRMRKQNRAVDAAGVKWLEWKPMRRR